MSETDRYERHHARVMRLRRSHGVLRGQIEAWRAARFTNDNAGGAEAVAIDGMLNGALCRIFEEMPRVDLEQHERELADYFERFILLQRAGFDAGTKHYA